MSFSVSYTDFTLFFLKGIIMRKQHNHRRNSVLSFEIHRLYRSGMNFREIASHLNISEKDVEPALIAYIKKHNINISELELHRSNVHKAKAQAEKDKKPIHQSFNESIQKKAIQIHVFNSKPTKKKSWISRCCSSVKNFVFFWK